MNTLEDFKNAIGKKFRVSWSSKSGILKMQDTIIKVDDDGTVEGNFVIADYTSCRFIQEQPEQLQNANG